MYKYTIHIIYTDICTYGSIRMQDSLTERRTENKLTSIWPICELCSIWFYDDLFGFAGSVPGRESRPQHGSNCRNECPSALSVAWPILARENSFNLIKQSCISYGWAHTVFFLACGIKLAWHQSKKLDSRMKKIMSQMIPLQPYQLVQHAVEASILISVEAGATGAMGAYGESRKR